MHTKASGLLSTNCFRLCPSEQSSQKKQKSSHIKRGAEAGCMPAVLKHRPQTRSVSPTKPLTAICFSVEYIIQDSVSAFAPEPSLSLLLIWSSNGLSHLPWAWHFSVFLKLDILKVLRASYFINVLQFVLSDVSLRSEAERTVHFLWVSSESCILGDCSRAFNTRSEDVLIDSLFYTTPIFSEIFMKLHGW